MFQIQFFIGFRIIPDSQNPFGIPDYRNSCCIPNIVVKIQNTAHRPTMQASYGRRTSKTAGKMTAKTQNLLFPWWHHSVKLRTSYPEPCVAYRDNSHGYVKVSSKKWY